MLFQKEQKKVGETMFHLQMVNYYMAPSSYYKSGLDLVCNSLIHLRVCNLSDDLSACVSFLTLNGFPSHYRGCFQQTLL